MRVNQILQGNTLDILKTIDSNIIDVCVTSPPYNKKEKNKGWLVKNVLYNAISDAKNEEEYQNEQVEILNEIFRITKPGGSFFYNHKVRWEKGEMIHPISWLSKSDWTMRQEIIWDRMIAANIRGWRFWQVDERIYWLHKPAGNKIGEELASRHALLTSIWRFPPERCVNHPAPFPMILPARAIFSVLDGKRGVVLDPYSGSGSTLVAAKLLGCDYLGIEISEDYNSMAEERIKNCENERATLLEELGKHFVSKTFKERKKNGENTGKFKQDKILGEKLSQTQTDLLATLKFMSSGKNLSKQIDKIVL
ncbi:site-specific DNA-methyltransferase [Patescibacteria group bacterium]|nr:MAG: site-specific DNA-methyltransferase [Patescibacteria group bacterium]